ncbi:MAG: lipoyl(octanoyl) transferase LipB [Candidatus Hydrogenedentales bacterium]|jgi:lipoate-protein ligase B
MNRAIETIRLTGHVPYSEAYSRQVERRKAVEEGSAGNALFLLEHRPVITLGRSFQPQNLLQSEPDLRALGFDVCRVDRGGDATYHGPGQLVAYPVLNLNAWTPSIQWYLRALESVLIAQLAEYGLEGGRLEGFTGVWVNGAKVAAVGIGVHGWVTFHGIALNVDPDMSHFSCIVPCGISDKPVTSLRVLLGKAPAMARVMDDFERHFRAQFEVVG